MNKQVANDFGKKIISKLPNDVLLKHGWVLLTTPVLLYAIDKVSEIVDKVMDNNYNLIVKANGVEVNLQKQPCAS